MKVGHGSSLVPVVCVFTFLSSLFSATRTVIVKADGVPAAFVDDLVNEKDPTTGKSRLPWIDEVFVHNGTRISNFYVRGISLSAPSWGMLETGQQTPILVRPDGKRFVLVEGLHRLEACKELGETTIRGYLVQARRH